MSTSLVSTAALIPYIGVLIVTSHLDGFDSDTLFNSMQEGGQGVFSLMVDPKNIVNVHHDGTPTFPMAPQERTVVVGQQLRVELNERSVSPIAGDVKVVWSNGFEGDTYHVQAEDLGTTLTAVAIFEGADMRPLEVTIECGPVILGPAPQIDRTMISVVGEARAEESFEVREYQNAYLYVDHSAFSTPIDSIDVAWIVDGEVIHEQTSITPCILNSELDLERLVAAATQVEVGEPETLELPDKLAQLPSALAELIMGQVLPGLDSVDDLTFVVPDADSHEHDVELPLAADAEAATEEVTVVDATTPFFTSIAQLPAGTAGSALSIEITSYAQGSESALIRVFAGIIGQGDSFALKPNAAVNIAEPRVGEEAWAKVKRKNFTPRPDTLKYQWLVNGEELVGETASTVDVIPEMRGRELSVLIEAIGKNAMTSTVEASLGVVTLGDAPEYLGEALEVLGKARVGKTLKLSFEHDFVLPFADSVEIQWMRGRTPIVGARGLKYEVALADVDEKLWARVLLRKLGHATAVLKTPKVRVKN